MRFLRFVALMLVVAIAYSAQAILYPSALTPSVSAFLTQLSNTLADFAPVRVFFVGTTRALVFFWMTIAAISFGVLAAPWPLTDAPSAATVATLWTPRARRRQRLGWAMISVGVLCSIAGLIAAWVQLIEHSTWTGMSVDMLPWLTLPAALVAQASPLLHQAPWLTLALWAVSLLCFFLGCGLFPARVRPTDSEQTARPVAHPTKSATTGWSLFLLLLAFAAVQVGWRLTDIPSFVDPAVAQVGLSASNWLRTGDVARFFGASVELEPGLASFSQLSIALPALFLYLTHDLLLSTRLAGLWATLVVLTATWLLGTELFRRVPHRIASDLSEDRGQAPALVATMVVMFTAATLLFSRLPVLLEMVGWGSLGCWALVRGWRTHDRLAMGLSGVLIGLSALIYTPGLAFVLIALGWWLGFSFVQGGWLPHHLPAQRTGALFRGHFVVWLLGLWLVIAPTVVVRWFALGVWLPPWQANWAMNWQATLLALGQQGDLSQLGGWSIPLLHYLLAPILVLAIGALVFNLDRRIGWLLLTWLGGGLVYASLFAPRAPLWPAILPLLPAVGLVVAFGIDRLRSTVLQSAGPWLRNLANYLLAGLILWVGLNNGADYYYFAHQQADSVSALGYELRSLPAGQNSMVVAPPNTAGVASDALQLRFLTNEWRTPLRTAVTFTETAPRDAPAGTVIFIAPAEPAILAEIQALYPEGTLFVRRDLLANPLLYRYTVPNEP